MLIFHSYVSLPEGTAFWRYSQLFSIEFEDDDEDDGDDDDDGGGGGDDNDDGHGHGLGDRHGDRDDNDC